MKYVINAYGVKSSIRKGEPSVIRVYTTVVNTTRPNTLKRIFRNTIEKFFVFQSQPILRKHCYTTLARSFNVKKNRQITYCNVRNIQLLKETDVLLNFPLISVGGC